MTCIFFDRKIQIYKNNYDIAKKIGYELPVTVLDFNFVNKESISGKTTLNDFSNLFFLGYKVLDSKIKILEKNLEQKKMIKKKGPKFYKKIVDGFFYFFELIVGRIKLGTQYGTSSLEILEKLAKLKKSGIITEKEFNDKKKKILDRI